MTISSGSRSSLGGPTKQTMNQTRSVTISEWYWPRKGSNGIFRLEREERDFILVTVALIVSKYCPSADSVGLALDRVEGL